MGVQFRWRAGGRRAISSTMAVVFILGMTIVAGTVLWLYRPPLPPAPISIQYVALSGQSEPSWGDPTDCSNTSINANCDNLPAFFIVFTSHSPNSIPLTLLAFDFRCNGTSLLNGTFNAMEVVPGTGASPAPSSPKLGHCGTWTPSSFGNTATYFNRLAFFEQIQVGSPVLKNGDQYVIYEHAPGCDRTGHCPEDDFHGAPPWCFTVPGACTIFISYVGHPSSLVSTIPVTNLLGH